MTLEQISKKIISILVQTVKFRSSLKMLISTFVFINTSSILPFTNSLIKTLNPHILISKTQKVHLKIVPL